MKVIIAVDQTDNWKQIIEATVKRSWPSDTIFRILTVVEPGADALDKTKTHQAHTADRVVHEARALMFEHLPGCTVYSEVRKGKAADELVTVAANWMVDKIILGTHGRKANRLIPATVPQLVSQNSCCSVDLVKLTPVKASVGESSLTQATAQ